MYDFGQAHIEFAGRRPTELSTPGLGKVHLYLRNRGIEPSEIDKLGLLIVPARELIAKARAAPAFSEDARLALVFPHIDPMGRQIDWWSARLIDTDSRPIVATSFAAAVEQKKWGKMFCPPQEAPHAYLVPTLEWSTLKKGDYVYIHESCIKAINGAKLGYWSVGLNGVRGWSARKHGVGLVDELRSLPWRALSLTPVIVFDSNAADNWDVQHAIGSLAARLYEITGQRAKHILLPRDGSGEHWGFDDFTVAVGEHEAKRFLDSAVDAPLVDLSEIELKKLALNDEVCIVRSLGRVVEQKTGTIMSRQTFTDVNYATWTAMGEEDKVISVPRAWLVDPRRVEVEALEYSPGEDRLVSGRFLNLWRGMGCEPEPGDVGPWLELLERQVPDSKLRAWLIQWFAYPVQHLGSKLNTFIHLYGPPGTGKNALLVPLMRMYGTNGIVIGKDQIASSFNSVYTARQFVNLDELHGGNEIGAVAITNRIKMLTTSETLTVNAKGQPEYTIRNHVNLVTTSNYSDSIKLDEGDRRAVVIQFGTRDTRIEQEFWDRYFKWAESGAALYDYLIRVNLSGFDPSGWAPATEWKELVTDATRGAMEKWVRDLWDDPDSVLPAMMQGAKIMTPEQLGAAYYPTEPGKNTPGLRNALGQRMQDMGFKRSGQVKIDGTPKRFWIIRERDDEWTNDMLRSASKIGRSKF